jgi:two-component system sensor histidine kinase UhpB
MIESIFIYQAYAQRMGKETMARQRPQRWWHRLSLFEKVILANCITLVCEAAAGLWMTSHTLESHHYLIDTTFLVLATVINLVINILILRASFRPLFRLLTAMQEISQGQTLTRVEPSTDSDMGMLASTFNTMLDQLEKTRKDQEIVILRAQEEERRRIARELHDETSQMLTALLIHIEVIGQRLASLPATAIATEERSRLIGELRALTQLTQRTLDTLRMLAQQLRPSVLDDLGLIPALNWLAEDSWQRFHLSVTVQIEPDAQCVLSGQLPPLYATTLFRITQESLTNIARHAHTDHATVQLTVAQAMLLLTITDEGCGFDTTQQYAGLGLRGMRERASLLNGTLTLLSTPGQGTTVRVQLPLPAQEGDDT